MHWFIADAPIRLKLKLAFGSLAALIALLTLAIWFTPTIAPWLGVALTCAAAALGFWYREAIATPYVSTVVRMEALAAGDLSSAILHTEYKDCVGRMTKAMFAFRDNAQAQLTLNAEAHEHALVVQGMTAYLRRLSQGDLTADIAEEYPAEYAGLRDHFNEAVVSLRGLVTSVKTTAESIRTGAVEIASASEDLARRTEANAASLEETSAAVSQMDQQLKATASAASNTVARAKGAIDAVVEGRTATDSAMQAMTDVADSAKGIDGVIEGLDKIAFQTRVLAMNAAVEAGRAGEAGRGFAVVADLVSALAMRAEEEAGRARDQLTATQNDILAAVDMVKKVDVALANIVGDVNEVHHLVDRIATDNQAQSTAVTQISSAISVMDEATQQNAAMVEQTSAAARGLNGEVKALTEQAAHFVVETAQRSPAPIVRAISAKPSTVPYRSPVRALPRPDRTAANAVAAPENWDSF